MLRSVSVTVLLILLRFKTPAMPSVSNLVHTFLRPHLCDLCPNKPDAYGQTLQSKINVVNL